MRAIPALLVTAAFAIGAPAAAAGGEPIVIGDREREAIAEAVREGLRDPDSARFRWLPHIATSGIYCGLVNARNGLGGYSGFVPFVAHVSMVAGRPWATLVGVGNERSQSPKTIAVMQTCLEDGLDPRDAVALDDQS